MQRSCDKLATWVEPCLCPKTARVSSSSPATLIAREALMGNKWM